MCLVSRFSQVGYQSVPWGLPGQSWLRISIYENSIKIQAWIMINVSLTCTSNDIFHYPVSTHQSWKEQCGVLLSELWLPAMLQCKFFLLDNKNTFFLLCGHDELCNLLAFKIILLKSKEFDVQVPLKCPQYDYCIFRHLIIFKYLPSVLCLHVKKKNAQQC